MPDKCQKLQYNDMLFKIWFSGVSGTEVSEIGRMSGYDCCSCLVR